MFFYCVKHLLFSMFSDLVQKAKFARENLKINILLLPTVPPRDIGCECMSVANRYTNCVFLLTNEEDQKHGQVQCERKRSEESRNLDYYVRE